MRNPHQNKKLSENADVVKLLWGYSKRLEERTDTFLAQVVKLKTNFNRKTIEDKMALAEKLRILVKKKEEEKA